MSGIEREPVFDPVAFGRSIRVLLAELNIQQREAARMIGVDKCVLNRICKRGAPPSIENYLRITAWMNGSAKASSHDHRRDRPRDDGGATAGAGENARHVRPLPWASGKMPDRKGAGRAVPPLRISARSDAARPRPPRPPAKPPAMMSNSAEVDIERLLREVRASGDWEDEHEAILTRWRERRGEEGKTAWQWWWKLPEDDLYREDRASRAEAIAAGLREEPGANVIEVIEARCWADDITAGDGDEMFAESRNDEAVTVAAND